ncbi:MAG TPA: hypothetical protein VG406_25740 [Isosphaeraceae bacterium]|jgi:hypothetical protein|nr:hypothetical protein [Isosphaeraceae bacterium]
MRLGTLRQNRLRETFGRWPLRVRLAAAGAVIVAAVVAVVLVLRANALRGLHDIGDPFDVAAFSKVEVPDERNAFVEYSQAARMDTRLSGGQKVYDQLDAALQGDWSKVPEPIRAWLEANRPALAVWRQGTEKPDALYHTPAEATVETLLPVTQDVRMFAQLALLEGSRLEAEGDMRGAWGWYRAALRSSRHVTRHGFLIERLIGASIHRMVAERLLRWGADPRVDAPLLREALGQVVAIDAMTPPNSYALKLEYLVLSRVLDDPDLPSKMRMLGVRRQRSPIEGWAPWLARGEERSRALARNEPERSKRVLKLIVANWLAYCDIHKERSPKVVDETLLLFEPDSSAPPAARALPPAEVVRWYESTIYARAMFDDSSWRKNSQASIDRERTLQAELVRFLTDQLDRRNRASQAAPDRSAPVGPRPERLPSVGK